MANNFKRIFGPLNSPVPLSYLDDCFQQLQDASTSTVSLTGAALIGFAPSGTGAVTRTVSARLGDVVSLKDFGATGDGSTDDSTSVQNAVNAIIAAGGGTIHVPMPAVGYKCNSTITIDKAPFIRFVGEGARITTVSGTDDNISGCIFINGVAGVLFHVKDTSTAGQYRTRGVEFDGVGVKQTDSSNDIAFKLSSNYDPIRFRRGAIRGGKYGIYYDETASPPVFNVKLDDFDIFYTQSGCYMPYGSGTDLLSMQWEDCIFRYNSRYAVEAQNGSSFYFKNCIVEANTLGGFYLAGVFDINIEDCHFEVNSPTGAEYDVHILNNTGFGGSASPKIVRMCGNVFTLDTLQTVQVKVDAASSITLVSEEYLVGSGASSGGVGFTSSATGATEIIGGVFDCGLSISGPVNYFIRQGHVLLGTTTDNTSGDKNGHLQLKETSSSGVYLGNTNNSGLKVLDWYEEGTWTPSLLFGGGNTSMTYSAQSGTFSRIGNTVVCWGRIKLSAKGSSTGAVTIAGLPYTVFSAADQTNTGGGVAALWNSFAAGITTSPHIYTASNSTTLNVRKDAAGGMVAMAETDFTDTSELNFTLLFRAA